MAAVIRFISLAGLLVFGSLLAVATLAPATFEKAARAFVLAEVRAQLDPIVESEAGQRLKSAYEVWQAQKNADTAETETDPVPDVAKQLAAVIEKLCHYGCGERGQLETTIGTRLRDNLSRLAEQHTKYAALARNKFKEIVTKVRRDFILFAASNLAIFAVLLATTFLGPRAYRALMLPTALLTVSTLVATGVYLFGQNWFFTILYDDYMGYGYLGYVAVLFVFLFCVFYVRTGPIVPGPVEIGTEAVEVCATGPLAACAEATVSCAEAIVDAFTGILSGLIPG